ncbi:MAG: C40 family peptidase [Weeksellaceae bacterium]
MKLKIFTILILSVFLVSSCSSRKKISYKSSSHTKKTERSFSSKDAGKVLKEAYRFVGTPYRYGGTTNKGMDCSGLVINAYDVVGINMPRISKDQAKEGKEIKLKDVREGDLVFFNTSGSGISHVGIVDKVKNGEIYFIHASTSQGVIVSTLENEYWKKRFVKATRVL